MILYQLRCDREHAFDAWFRDSQAYDKQSGHGLLECPACGSTKISKALMTPRIGAAAKKKGTDLVPAQKPETQVRVANEAVELRRKLGELRRRIEENCDYVGPQFAEEARKIHYGETDAHGIYGETSAEDARALAEEGIEFGSVPWLPKENA
jgi:hypothetical protein